MTKYIESNVMYSYLSLFAFLQAEINLVHFVYEYIFAQFGRQEATQKNLYLICSFDSVFIFTASSSSSRSYRRQLKTAIVFDNGSQYMKVGLIDEKKPSIELPNVIARDIVESFNSRFIGLDAVKNCTLSAFEYPILGKHILYVNTFTYWLTLRWA